MKNEAHTLSVWRSYRFRTRHEADLFQKAFKLDKPLKEFDERIGQTVFVFQW